MAANWTNTYNSGNVTFNSGFQDFGTQSIGTPSSDRLVIVMYAGHPNTPASVGFTIGGNAANQAVFEGSSGSYTTSIFWLLVTSGTTADLACSGTIFTSVASISVGSLTGCLNQAPTGAQVATFPWASATTPSFNLTIPSGGWGFGVYCADSTSIGGTFTAPVTSDQFANTVTPPIVAGDSNNAGVTAFGLTGGGGHTFSGAGAAFTPAPVVTTTVDASGGGAIYKLRRPGWPRAAAMAPAYARKNGVLVPSREIIRPRLVGWRRPLAA